MQDTPLENLGLGEYLKQHRKLSGKTQRAIGGSAISSSYISMVESGDISDVSVTRLLELADAYGLTISGILNDVYGYEMDSTSSPNSQALAIGEAVMSLPEPRKELTIEWIQLQTQKSD